MKKNILHKKSFTEINEDLVLGNISVTDIANEVIENYDSDPVAKSAYVEFNSKTILQKASQIDKIKDSKYHPLMGIPTSVKDLYGVENYKTRAGSPKELPEKWEKEGPILDTLQYHNSLITGKTHTVEFAFGGVGINPHWGTPINPWDSNNHRVPGGSSAGAGVSLCTGTAALALGTDTAGSVRIPASVTGNVGLKTTKNRWSTDGIVPLSKSFDTPGTLTHTVEDTIYAFEEFDKSSLYFKNEKKLVIDDDIDFKFTTYDWFNEKCDDDIISEFEKVLTAIEKKSSRTFSKNLNEIDEAYFLFTQGGLAAAEFASFINGEMSHLKDSLDPNVAFRIKDMHTFSAIEYLQRKDTFEEMTLSINSKFDEFDVIITPTVPISPPIVSDLADSKKYSEANGLMLRNTSPVNLLGLCAISIPIALDQNNMPIGMQIIAPSFKERKLLSIAQKIENQIGNKYQNLD